MWINRQFVNIYLDLLGASSNGRIAVSKTANLGSNPSAPARKESDLKIFGKELKLLILDVDGVLVDLMVSFEKVTTEAALEMGLSVKPFEKYLKDLKNGTNKGYSSFSKSVKMLWPHLNDGEIQKFKKIFHKKEKQNLYPAIPGSISIIYRFHRSIPIAICTTNELSILKCKLEHAGFKMNWFSFISSWESSHPKPDPRALTIITNALNIQKENSLFVGDWYPDWECSKAAEIPFIAVLSGGIPKHAFVREGIPENHILNTLSDIIKIIEP